MDDLISRQAAVDAIKKDRDASDMPKMWYQGVDYAINHLIHLPSAQPEQRWISCSERLPKISSARLALRYSNGLVSGGTYLGNKTFDVDFPDCNKKTTVVEWMPLPEPPKGEQDED